MKRKLVEIFRTIVSKSPALNRHAKRRLRVSRANSPEAFPRWAKIVAPDAYEWRSAIAQSRGGKKILIATGAGGHLSCATVESLLAVALTLRGSEPHFLLCDESLPACIESNITLFADARDFASKGPDHLCEGCWKPAREALSETGAKIHNYGSLFSTEDRVQADRIEGALSYAEIPAFTYDGLQVGEHALAGALRFFARGNLDLEPDAEPVVRRYLRAALLTVFAVRRLLVTERYEAVVLNHGIYVPQGLVVQVAKSVGIRVITWNPGYRKKSFIFSHDDTYHHTLMNEPVSSWTDMAWSREAEMETLRYLKSRWFGTEDWIWFHDKPKFDIDAIKREIGFDEKRPLIGMLTSVMWDAQLHYPSNAFPGMLDWVIQTIQYFKSRPDLRLVIRVHPAEVNGALPSRQSMSHEIANAFPNLPENVVVIPPENPVSTYPITELCDSIIIYNTKTGVELATMGIPVIVAGEAWIRNKGVTLDATTSAEYFSILDTLPLVQRMDEAATQRARRYAFHFFFRRMIPIACMEPVPGAWPPFRVQSDGLASIRAGGDPGLDVICDGILNGSPFIYKAEEQLFPHAKTSANATQ